MPKWKGILMIDTSHSWWSYESESPSFNMEEIMIEPSGWCAFQGKLDTSWKWSGQSAEFEAHLQPDLILVTCHHFEMSMVKIMKGMSEGLAGEGSRIVNVCWKWNGPSCTLSNQWGGGLGYCLTTATPHCP
jgi:hypothetical protein